MIDRGSRAKILKAGKGGGGKNSEGKRLPLQKERKKEKAGWKK